MQNGGQLISEREKEARLAYDKVKADIDVVVNRMQTAWNECCTARSEEKSAYSRIQKSTANTEGNIKEYESARERLVIAKKQYKAAQIDYKKLEAERARLKAELRRLKTKH